MSDIEQPLSFNVSTDAWVARQQLPSETSQISYHSSGHALLICNAFEQVEGLLDSFKENGVTVAVIDTQAPSMDKQLLDTGTAVFTVPTLALDGYLGAFKAIVQDAKKESSDFDLAVAVFRESGAFDLVLDCCAEPCIEASLKPFGYAHCIEGSGASEAIEELLGFVGEFDKPKYFDYNASVCAHSRSELSGCSRCIDVCATGAISHDGEGVSVDPYLCQGCGSCATVCPSGAMSYAYPRPADAIKRSRKMLSETSATTLLLYNEKQQDIVSELELTADIHTLLVEEVTAYGLDYWLTLLAGHVQRIVVLVSNTTNDASDNKELVALEHQQSILHALLGGLGITTSVLHFLPEDKAQDWRSLEEPNALLAQVPPSSFSTHNNKRQTVRLALDVMAETFMPTLAEKVSETPLPAGAPFGLIHVNTDACTLCMACVSTCPSQALQDGQDTPALRFVEQNCVQCGLCTQACPESALTLEPQYQWDSNEARKVKTLHEDQPFHCITCHTPFATSGVISAMASRLTDHWMFQDDKALRRLKMCGDCRVKDIFREDAAGIETHKEPS